jgi:hypothetical protein
MSVSSETQGYGNGPLSASTSVKLFRWDSAGCVTVDTREEAVTPNIASWHRAYDVI